MKYLNIITLLIISLSGFSQIERPSGQLYVLVHPPAHVVPKDTIRINFSRTAKPLDDHVNFFGHVGPANGSVKTVTMNNISVTSAPTSNWGNLSGNTAYDGFGTTAGVWFTAGNGTENAIMRNQVVNNNTYNSGAHQFVVSGLKPSSTYTVSATGSVNSGSSAGRTTGMRWQGSGAISSEFTYNPGGTTGANTSSGTTFTITPDSSGEIKLWMYAGAGSPPGVLCAITIEEN